MEEGNVVDLPNQKVFYGKSYWGPSLATGLGAGYIVNEGSNNFYYAIVAGVVVFALVSISILLEQISSQLGQIITKK